MSASPRPSPSSPPVVLVVEDAEQVRELAARALAREGYRVLTAGDGVEALELLEREAVAARARWPRLPMLFMTGHPEAALTADLPGPLIMKPFVLEHLLAAIRSAVEA